MFKLLIHITIMGRKFRIEWLSFPEFKDWLKQDKADETKFRCFVCGVSREISSTGKSALTKHGEGKKHIDKVTKRNNFFKVKESPKIPTADSDEVPGTSSTTNVLELAVDTTDSTVAVIRWVLKCVESGFSGRSCVDLGLLMQTMFPIAKNAQRMQLGRDKFGYIESIH